MFKVVIKTTERRQWRRSGVFILNSEKILHIVRVFSLLALNTYMPDGYWHLSWLGLLSRCLLAHFITYLASVTDCYIIIFEVINQGYQNLFKVINKIRWTVPNDAAMAKLPLVLGKLAIIALD